MDTHSSIPAWRIPWTEEPGGLQSMCHKETDMIEQLTHTHTHTHTVKHEIHGINAGFPFKNSSTLKWDINVN